MSSSCCSNKISEISQESSLKFLLKPIVLLLIITISLNNVKTISSFHDDQEEKLNDGDLEEKTKIIVEFFKHQGLIFDIGNNDKINEQVEQNNNINKYNKNIVELMKEYNRFIALNSDSAALDLSCRIAQTILKHELNKIELESSIVDQQESAQTTTTKITQDGKNRDYQAALNALDLLVPTKQNGHNGQYKQKQLYYLDAKKELRQFYQQSPELAGELLDRLIDRVLSEEYEIRDVARLLRNFYDHWIPLGQLMLLAQAQSQAS